jgi:hypothetical protein
MKPPSAVTTQAMRAATSMAASLSLVALRLRALVGHADAVAVGELAAQLAGDRQHGERDRGEGDQAADTPPGRASRPRRSSSEPAKTATTVRFNAMCSRPVRNARGPVGMANRSRKPSMAAAAAPTRPTTISHQAPLAKTTGSPEKRDARSNTKLATQAPIGTVTSTGCSGCP